MLHAPLAVAPQQITMLSFMHPIWDALAGGGLGGGGRSKRYIYPPTYDSSPTRLLTFSRENATFF